MRSPLQNICDLFVENRKIIRSVFGMEYSMMYPVCANIFCEKGMTARPEKLRDAKEIIKRNTGVFSNFRGNVRMPVACMLAAGDDPQARMERTMKAYAALKKIFWSSDYLALSAFLVADLAWRADISDGDMEARTRRGREIYDRMKKEHPLLTSQEDSVFATLMAFSEKTDDGLIYDMETAFQRLQERFHRNNGTQAASHVLALTDGRPEDNAARMIALYDGILDAGGKYGKYHHLATLADLSLREGDIQQKIVDLMDLDSFLSTQKGYGFFGIDRRTRMMHAAMLLSSESSASTPAKAAALSGTLAMVIAQQVATMAAISSTAAVSAATASSH